MQLAYEVEEITGMLTGLSIIFDPIVCKSKRADPRLVNGSVQVLHAILNNTGINSKS